MLKRIMLVVAGTLAAIGVVSSANGAHAINATAAQKSAATYADAAPGSSDVIDAQLWDKFTAAVRAFVAAISGNVE